MESSIVSDITTRTLLVRGRDEVERISRLNDGKHIFEFTPQGSDTYEVRLTYKVGSLYRKGGE